MENTNNLKQIVDKEDFDQMLNLAKTFIYILVNWSGPERISRNVVYKVLSDLTIVDIPIFKIDCSEQENKFVEDWLRDQSSSMQYFYSNGYGEILLVKHGKVVDYIKYPGELGIEKTKIRIEHWLHDK